jgi:hypothetical protein
MTLNTSDEMVERIDAALARMVAEGRADYRVLGLFEQSAEAARQRMREDAVTDIDTFVDELVNGVPARYERYRTLYEDYNVDWQGNLIHLSSGQVVRSFDTNALARGEVQPLLELTPIRRNEELQPHQEIRYNPEGDGHGITFGQSRQTLTIT